MAQPFRAFRGAVYAVGLKPDGDTISFRPHDPAALALLPDPSGKTGAVELDADRNGAASVRLQGIDALETHYQPQVGDNKPAGAVAPAGVTKPSAGNHHQRLALSRLAAESLLGMLGIEVTSDDWHSWGHLRRVTVAGRVVADKFQEGVEAVVVSDSVDLNGRVLGWVFPASAPFADGEVVDPATLVAQVKGSLNGRMLALGHAYPYYFMTLSSALRAKLNTCTSTAQRYRRGVWAEDASRSGLTLRTVTELNDQAVLMPYLFRKLLRSWRLRALATYWSGGDVSSSALEALAVTDLFVSGDPYVYVSSTRDFLRLDEVVRVEGDTLTLLVKPHEIVFLE